MEAIKHIHMSCHELCMQSVGKHLPVAGNIGIFCHYDDEYELLTKLSGELTDTSDSFNGKYFRLHEPITIPAEGDVPEATYTYLYIRKPDPYRYQVGDLDFYMDTGEYTEFKESLLTGEGIKGARVYYKPEKDMVELYDPDIDTLGYVSNYKMPS